ncbi:MAG: hypothetical protein IPI21_17925 [Propionivibrio sp.]|nr:hypothetical protein [Propionivibrio sp.]
MATTVLTQTVTRKVLKTRWAWRSPSGVPNRRPRLLIRNSGMAAAVTTCRARAAVFRQCGNRRQDGLVAVADLAGAESSEPHV